MIIVQQHGPDAGDAAASLIGSIFTFFLWVGLAGCCCACCAVRYCMLKASQASEQAPPTTWLGRMRSAVRRRANPARPSLPKTAERPAQNHALALAEAAPPLAQVFKARTPPVQTAYAVVVDAPQGQHQPGLGASSADAKPPPPPPPPPPPEGFVGTFHGPAAVVMGQPLL